MRLGIIALCVHLLERESSRSGDLRVLAQKFWAHCVAVAAVAVVLQPSKMCAAALISSYRCRAYIALPGSFASSSGPNARSMRAQNSTVDGRAGRRSAS